MWSLVTYSHSLIIYHQLILHGSAIKVRFVFSTVYCCIIELQIANDYMWCYICSAWFLDIRISTCLIKDFYIELFAAFLTNSMHTHTHTPTRTHKHGYTHNAYTHIHICIHPHAHTHTCTHTHTHTHMQYGSIKKLKVDYVCM